MPQLSTALTAVTVYPDRARLVRTGKVDLEPGLHALEVPDLPLQLDPDSVRAAARGTARARLQGVQVIRTFFTETPAEQVRELEAQVEAVQDSIRGLDARADLLQKQRANLEALAGKAEVFATALASGEMSVEAHLALLDSLRARAEALEAEGRTLGAEKREAQRRLEKLQNELNQRRSARPRQRYAASVEIEVLQPGELAVELSYVVSGAGWQPLYDLRLLEEGEQPVLELSYLAQVVQGTGEAWENVGLTLSTARPALAGRLPELDPWYVQPLPPPRPEPLPRFSEPGPVRMAAKSAPPAPEMLSAALPEADAEVVTAGVEASGAAVTYSVPVPVSVPTGAAPHKVLVARLSLPPDLDYVSAPKQVPAAYRRAKVRNDSPYLLLPGQANLFAGAEFVGATALELTAPQGEIELYLGVDDRLKIERELKRREVDKRFIGGRRRIAYGYEIKLENLLPVAARLSLHDQFPVSRHEEIKVRLETADPRTTRQTELNELEWDLTLSPGEKRLVRFDFTVEHPQGMEVVGLP
jgi:uncharacterized protein (TIGR02231 family)